jgi:hypothetical protein
MGEKAQKAPRATRPAATSKTLVTSSKKLATSAVIAAGLVGIAVMAGPSIWREIKIMRM